MAVEGYGSVWWGLSPPLDLLTINPPQDPIGDTINILLVGCGDLRHVLQSIATAGSTRLHFYIIESSLEVLARHILFLALITEPFGLREKVELYLELYGNSLVRPQTIHYLREISTELIKMITDPEHSSLPMLDVSLLKFSERDLLEGIFKFWRDKDESNFDMQQHWEGRLRHHLGVRYDSRKGVFDWDYNMRLLELTSTVGLREYCHWRERGVAFQLRDDAPYESSNRTLASGAIVSQGRERTAKRGYWGDIVVSPFISMGSWCPNKEMLKTTNGRNAKSCQQIAEYNMLCLTHQLLTGQRYRDNTNGGDTAIIEEPEEEESFTGPLINGSCKVTLLPLKSATEIGRKARYKGLFNYAVFSNSMVHTLNGGGIETTFADSCTILCETARYLLELSKEHKLEYIRRVTGMASNAGFVTGQPLAEDMATLVFTRH